MSKLMVLLVTIGSLVGCGVSGQSGGYCDSYSPQGICLKGVPMFLPEEIDTAYAEVEGCIGLYSTNPLEIIFDPNNSGTNVSEFDSTSKIITVRVPEIWALKHQIVFYLHDQNNLPLESGYEFLQSCGF